MGCIGAFSGEMGSFMTRGRGEKAPRERSLAEGLCFMLALEMDRDVRGTEAPSLFEIGGLSTLRSPDRELPRELWVKLQRVLIVPGGMMCRAVGEVVLVRLSPRHDSEEESGKCGRSSEWRASGYFECFLREVAGRVFWARCKAVAELISSGWGFESSWYAD